MNSIWTGSVQLPSFEPLKEDIRTDVLIIGGGMTGLLCAYLLTEAGVNCTLVEADQIAGGVTGNTTAKITVQHGPIYHRLIRKFGAETAQMYYQANAAALERYRTMAEHIECDFSLRDSIVYST